MDCCARRGLLCARRSLDVGTSEAVGIAEALDSLNHIMKVPPMPLIDRLELAAQACRAAHLLSCETTCREAIAELSSKPAPPSLPERKAMRHCRNTSDCQWPKCECVEDLSAPDEEAERRRFEDWISKPPYEKNLARFHDAGTWPGAYKDYTVHLAWDAWQAASNPPQKGST